ncbi:MAG TPA: P-II family nitrogen regulator [Nitrososphaeraceae archaeon]
MKRIEAIIASEKVSDLNSALKEMGVGGCTILDAKGRGKGEKPLVEAQRGTARYTAEFSVRANVVTVVQDSIVEKVIKTILDTVSTGSAGDGKIFISAVVDSVDIGTKSRGEEAIS